MALNLKAKILIQLPALKEAVKIIIDPQDSDVEVVFNKNNNYLELRILPGSEDFEIKASCSEISVLRKQNTFNAQVEEVKGELNNELIPIIEPLSNNEIEALIQDVEKKQKQINKTEIVTQEDPKETNNKVLFEKLNEANLSAFKNEVPPEAYNFENNTLPVVDNIVEALSKVIKKEEDENHKKEEKLKEESHLRVMEAFKKLDVESENNNLNVEIDLSEQVSGETVYFDENVREFKSFAHSFKTEKDVRAAAFSDISVETIYDKNVLLEIFNDKNLNFSQNEDSERLNVASETFQETELEVLETFENTSFDEADTSLMPRTFLTIETPSAFEEENKTIIMEKINDNFIFNEKDYVFSEDLPAGEDFDIKFLQFWEEKNEEAKFKNSWREVKVLDLGIKNINVKKNS